MNKELEKLTNKFNEDYTQYKKFRLSANASKTKKPTRELVLFAKRLNKQLNQRFYRLEKAGLEKQSQAYKFALDENNRRYTVSENKIANMTSEEVLEMVKNTLRKLATVTSTKVGIRETEKRRKEMSANAFENLSAFMGEDRETRNKIKDAWKKTLENKELYELFDNEWIPSDSVLELWYNNVYSGNVSEESFMEFMKDARKKRMPPHKIEKNLRSGGYKNLK